MTGQDGRRLRTLIVDDEPLAVERLQILCADCPEIELVGTANEGQSGLALAAKVKPDLVLLDIEMPTMDGIAAARALHALQPGPAVVLVTAFDNFALEAFDLDIVDYLLKPVSPERLQRAVARVMALTGKPAEEHAPQGDYASEFWVSHRSELIRIAAIDIDRIEAERDYMRLHTGGRSYLLHETISTLEQRLNPAHFQRIHRSHIVRRSLLSGLRHEGGGVWHALLDGGQSLRIGRKYLADVKRLAGK
jgi:DNA-binding LytR/AlgR family response regulator